MAKPRAPSLVHGAVVIDKPIGPTSFAVMRSVGRALGSPKAGHAGTLDPRASGALAVMLGEGTKLSSLLMDHDKSYRATIALGASTDTLDSQGQVTATAPVPELVDGSIVKVLEEFVGSYDQIPPVYSAIKKDGRSLMSRARAGETDIPAEPRRVTCDALRLVACDATSLTLDIDCGKGFYVRSLARDVAVALGTLGHITALRRTRLGAFDVADALAPDAVTAQAVLPLTRMVPGLATLSVSATDADHIHAGRPMLVPVGGPEQAIAIDQAGQALAWIRKNPERMTHYRVERGFCMDLPD